MKVVINRLICFIAIMFALGTNLYAQTIQEKIVTGTGFICPAGNISIRLEFIQCDEVSSGQSEELKAEITGYLEGIIRRPDFLQEIIIPAKADRLSMGIGILRHTVEERVINKGSP